MANDLTIKVEIQTNSYGGTTVTLTFPKSGTSFLSGGVEMQQQSNVTNGQKQNSILVLLLNWIIILGVYLLIRIVFIVLGFHLYTPLLGGLLAIIPYLLGTIYLWKSCNQYKNLVLCIGYSSTIYR